MSDEDLLIGAGKQDAATQGASGIKTPQEIQSLAIFGILKDSDEAIEQKMTLRIPRGVPNDQKALFVWDEIAKLGGLTTVGTAGEYNFYPLSSGLFKRLTLKFNEVVGVTL